VANLTRIKDIAGLVRDIGVIVGVPTIITVGVSLYDLQAKSFEQQVKANEAQIKATEAQVKVLEAQNSGLKEIQFDRAAQLIKGQKEVYEAEHETLLKQISELRQSGDQRVAALEERLRQTTNDIRRSDVAISALGKASNVVVRTGISPEDVAQLAKALTGGAEDRVRELAEQSSVSTSAIQTFLRILGEQDLPTEELPAKLAEIALQYNRARDALSSLDPDDAASKVLMDQAKAELTRGNFDGAQGHLQSLAEAEIAAAARARATENVRLLAAAKAWEQRGDIALTQTHKGDVAEYFGRAASLVPASSSAEKERLLRRQADALAVR
jgi:hypothetical protein